MKEPFTTLRAPKDFLNNVVVAVEPVENPRPTVKAYTKMISRLQEANIIPSVQLVAMIHQSLFIVPPEWYYEQQDRYAEEAKSRIESMFRNKLEFRAVHVLKAKSPSNRLLVQELSTYLSRIQSELLVVLSSNRSGLPHWLLGSFAETAALSAAAPVLILKPQSQNLRYSRSVRFTVALDPTEQYPSSHLNYIIKLARASQAEIDLVSVKPKAKGLFSALKKSKPPQLSPSAAKAFHRKLIESGVKSTLKILPEQKSIADTIINYAETKKTWSIICPSSDKKPTQKLLMGSCSRKILALTKRPFLALRFGEK